jgi:uracil-DNA glycosylase
MNLEQLPRDWRKILTDEFEQPYFQALRAFVDRERAEHTVYPPEEDVFNAFRATPFKKVKVLLLGQDPYHGPGQAHGMCFSVRPGVRPPPSLVNMFKELHGDQGCKIPNNGYLEPWAKEGVLLLNAVLTVRAGQPNSHKGHGWEQFTDAALRALDGREEPVIFALWGGYAQKKAKLVTHERHRVVKAAHPSPLSAAKFLGSKPYSAINAALAEVGESPIDWCIPDRP